VKGGFERRLEKWGEAFLPVLTFKVEKNPLQFPFQGFSERCLGSNATKKPGLQEGRVGRGKGFLTVKNKESSSREFEGHNRNNAPRRASVKVLFAAGQKPEGPSVLPVVEGTGPLEKPNSEKGGN